MTFIEHAPGNREALLEAIFQNMQQMHRAGTSRFQTLMHKHDISLSQMELLMTVKHHQPISAKAIAASMRLTPGAVTQLVESLTAKGLLDKQEDAHDRRVINISLAEGGKQKLHTVLEQRLQLMKKIMHSLETDELAVMLRVQKKMLEHIEAEAAKGDKKETK